MWGLTSDPLKHITRRLLSYLNHQETTESRRGPPLSGAQKAPSRVPWALTCQNCHNRSCTCVLGDTMWVLTSDPSKYVRRHLLSCRNHQKTMVSQSWSTSYRCARAAIPGVRNRQNRPRTYVSGYLLRVLTSDPSNHVPRCLMSYLDHQQTSVSCPSPSYRSRERSRPGGETV